MSIDILMPALSPTMEEGTLAKWLKKEGDAVKSGDIIAEIETDKATMEFEAVDEGILGKILIPEGTEAVKVNTPIAIMIEEGESADFQPFREADGGRGEEPVHDRGVGEQQLQGRHGADAAPEPAVGEQADAPEGMGEGAAVEEIDRFHQRCGCGVGGVQHREDGSRGGQGA